MKRAVLAATLGAALLFTGACKKRNDKEAIRAGVIQHLTALNNLNMSAMDINVAQLTINGNQAQAQVEFRPKTGAPPGAGMQVSYNLEKRDGNWVVLKSLPMGGEIIHPAPGQAPSAGQPILPEGHPPLNTGNSAVPSGHSNFNDIIPPQPGAAGGTLPPGHPPANPQGQQAPPVPPASPAKP